ncbi:hypothetical protein ACJ72_08776, partial [Emergomyces africanus]
QRSSRGVPPETALWRGPSEGEARKVLEKAYYCGLSKTCYEVEMPYLEPDVAEDHTA